MLRYISALAALASAAIATSPQGDDHPALSAQFVFANHGRPTGASSTDPQEPRELAFPPEIADLVKATVAKFKAAQLADLVKKLQDSLREQVTPFSDDASWIGTTRAMAAHITTPVEAVPNEFGPIHPVTAKSGRGPFVPELFHPHTLMYRFAQRDYAGLVDPFKAKPASEPKDMAPTDQLSWMISGHTPEAELAIATIQRELDVDRSRDKFAHFLEHWRNGRESFYEALDRTAGTKDAVFFYDAMLAEFVDKLAPSLMAAKSLSEKHDRLHDAFLTLRNYRNFIEAISISLVSTQPLPPRLRIYEWSTTGSAQIRDGLELLLASNKGDIVKTVQAVKDLLIAHPMPAELWGKYELTTVFIAWCQENSKEVKERIKLTDATIKDFRDYELSVRCRKKREDAEHEIRTAARTFLEEHGVAPKKPS